MTKKRIVKKIIKKSLVKTPLLILGAITLGVIAWYSWPRPVKVDINMVGDVAGSVTLALTPPAVALTPNTESTLTLTIDTTTSHVTGATIEIIYEPTKIGTPVVTLGDFLPNVLAPVKMENGRLSFTLAAPPDSGGIIGSGTLAKIKIKPPIAGTSSLTFGEMNGVFALGNQSNQIKLASDTTITVTNPVVKPNKPTGLRSNCFDGGKKITYRWDAVTGVDSYKLRTDQKDGGNDKSIDNITKTEYELDIIPNQKYSWWVHSTKNNVDSEEAKIDSVLCEVTLATPTPTPTPKPTPKPTIKPKTKGDVVPTDTPIPKPTATPKVTATPIATASPSLKPNAAGGSLNDIFKDTDEVKAGSSKSETKPGFFQMIALGWKSILDSLANMFK